MDEGGDSALTQDSAVVRLSAQLGNVRTFNIVSKKPVRVWLEAGVTEAQRHPFVSALPSPHRPFQTIGVMATSHGNTAPVDSNL